MQNVLTLHHKVVYSKIHGKKQVKQINGQSGYSQMCFFSRLWLHVGEHNV